MSELESSNDTTMDEIPPMDETYCSAGENVQYEEVNILMKN
jgi:hypothetical protein